VPFVFNASHILFVPVTIPLAVRSKHQSRIVEITILFFQPLRLRKINDELFCKVSLTILAPVSPISFPDDKQTNKKSVPQFSSTSFQINFITREVQFG